MHGVPSETPVSASDASRSALDCLHRLLCRPAAQAAALEEVLAELAAAFRIATAGIAGLPDGWSVVQHPPGAEGTGARVDAEVVRRARQAPAAIAVAAEGGSRLLTAFGPAGAGWLLWLEDPGRGQWTAGEAAALALVGQVLGRILEAGGEAPRWVAQLERAARQERLESAARLTRRLAHDFGNVLTGILGFTELALGQQVPAHSALFNYLTEVHRGAEAGARLTQQLRLFAGRQVAVRQPCRLAAVLAEDEVRRRAGVETGIDWQVSVPNDLPALAVDAGLLRTALGALLENAREALNDPSRPAGAPRGITVAARALVLDPAACRDLYGSAQPGPHVEILLADTGPGLSAEVRERLFAEPFLSGRSRRGFGLATVYGVLFAHRGGFELRSGPEGGVEARLVLPAAAAPEPARETPAAVRAPGGEKILVVDDDDKMRALVSRILEQAGFRVQAVGSGEEALETYTAAADDPFGAVVTDVVMPGITGMELAHRLLHRDPQVRVLFMTGHAGADVLCKTFQDAAFEMLYKPFRT